LKLLLYAYLRTNLYLDSAFSMSCVTDNVWKMLHNRGSKRN
jgi:hypothetical protein